MESNSTWRSTGRAEGSMSPTRTPDVSFSQLFLQRFQKWDELLYVNQGGAPITGTIEGQDGIVNETKDEMRERPHSDERIRGSPQHKRQRNHALWGEQDIPLMCDEDLINGTLFYDYCVDLDHETGSEESDEDEDEDAINEEVYSTLKPTRSVDATKLWNKAKHIFHQRLMKILNAERLEKRLVLRHSPQAPRAIHRIPRLLCGLSRNALEHEYPSCLRSLPPYETKVALDVLSVIGSRDATTRRSRLGTVLTDTCIPEDCVLYYFEARVCPRVVENPEKRVPLVTVGVMCCFPMYEDVVENSMSCVGYENSEGYIISSDGTKTYEERYTWGDVVGCCVDMVHKKITFTKNGKIVAKPVPLPQRKVTTQDSHKGSPGLYPMITIDSAGDRVVVNFGCSSCVRFVNGALGVQLLSTDRRDELSSLLEQDPESGEHPHAAVVEALKHSSCVCIPFGMSPTWTTFPPPYNCPPPCFLYNYEELVKAYFQEQQEQLLGLKVKEPGCYQLMTPPKTKTRSMTVYDVSMSEAREESDATTQALPDADTTRDSPRETLADGRLHQLQDRSDATCIVSEPATGSGYHTTENESQMVVEGGRACEDSLDTLGHVKDNSLCASAQEETIDLGKKSRSQEQMEAEICFCKSISVTPNIEQHIRSFLLHCGYTKTLQTFNKELGKQEKLGLGLQESSHIQQEKSNLRDPQTTRMAWSIVDYLDRRHVQRIIADLDEVRGFWGSMEEVDVQDSFNDLMFQAPKSRFLQKCMFHFYTQALNHHKSISTRDTGHLKDNTSVSGSRSEVSPERAAEQAAATSRDAEYVTSLMLVDVCDNAFLWVNDHARLTEGSRQTSPYFFWSLASSYGHSTKTGVTTAGTSCLRPPPLSSVCLANTCRQLPDIKSDNQNGIALSSHIPRLTLSGLAVIEHGLRFLFATKNQNQKVCFLGSVLTACPEIPLPGHHTEPVVSPYCAYTPRIVATLLATALLRYEIRELILSGGVLTVIEFFRVCFPCSFLDSPLPNALVMLLTHYLFELFHSLDVRIIEGRHDADYPLLQLVRTVDQQRLLWILRQDCSGDTLQRDHALNATQQDIPFTSYEGNVSSLSDQWTAQRDSIALWWLHNVLWPLYPQFDDQGCSHFLDACQVLHDPKLKHILSRRRRYVAKAVHDYLLSCHFGIDCLSPLALLVKHHGYARGLLKKARHSVGPLVTPKSLMLFGNVFSLKHILLQPLAKVVVPTPSLEASFPVPQNVPESYATPHILYTS